jgi:pimeloyl-ACP methyl ester carboxylesterase
MKKVFISMHDNAHAEIHHFVEEARKAQSMLEFDHVMLPDNAKKELYAASLEANQGCKNVVLLKDQFELEPEDSLIVVVDGNIRDKWDDEYLVVDGKHYGPTGGTYRGVALISLYYLNPASEFMKKSGGWWAELPDSERSRIKADSVLLLILCAIAYSVAGLKAHEESRGCIMDYCQTTNDMVAALTGGFRFCAEECVPLLQKQPHGETVLQIAKWLSSNPFRFLRLPTGEFDVFMCHNSEDKPAVRTLTQQLKQRGIFPWLDEEQLRPGFPWQKILEEQIDKIRTAAVFIGKDGIGPWQNLEIDAFIRNFINRKAPVIPVILPVTAGTPKLPVFLGGMTRVDFRKSDPEPMQQLAWGITGGFSHSVRPAPSDTMRIEPPSAGIPASKGAAQAGHNQPGAGRMVITLHGIRTRGTWQKDLDSELAQCGLVPKSLDYGFFRALRLVIPSSRLKQIEWFRDKYTDIRAENQGEKPSVVAHSFGTFLVASALDLYPEIELEQVIFCGSIVDRSFEWSRIVEAGRIKRLLNDCGSQDLWVKVAGWVIKEGGASGAYGFKDKAGGRLRERHHPQFRHSDYFYRLNFQRNWIPFLKGGDPQDEVLAQKRPRNWRFLVVKIAIVSLITFILWKIYRAFL